MVLTDVKQKIKLVEGQFTPSEAVDVISALIDEKINFHKLQRLSLREGDENADTSYTNNRIQELMREKQIAKDFINNARCEGCKVRIDGILQITFE
jgi:hypothetical protein